MHFEMWVPFHASVERSFAKEKLSYDSPGKRVLIIGVGVIYPPNLTDPHVAQLQRLALRRIGKTMHFL
jgi:hypothetical protein